MKAIKLLLSGLLMCLLSDNQAYAIATYDYLSDVTISFSRLWESYIETITSIKSATGEATASTAPSQNFDLANLSYYQSAQITGSAGDIGLSRNGTSHAYNQVVTSFTFNLSSVPTDLTITLNDWNQVLTSSTQLHVFNGANQTGEYVGHWPTLGGGGTGLQILFDNANGAPLSYVKGDSVTFHNLTGLHTLLLTTSADESALAGYPYAATPEPSSLLLLSLSILGLALSRRAVACSSNAGTS